MLPVSPLCLSSLGGNSYPYVFSSLLDLKRVVDSFVCSAIYLLLGQSGNIQALYMQNLRKEGLSCFLCNYNNHL